MAFRFGLWRNDGFHEIKWKAAPPLPLLPGGARVAQEATATRILINGETLVVANVGDSRAVACDRAAGRARQLSVDHEPLREREAVERRGGVVTEIHGDVPRVDAQLATSRAFGDRQIKEHISSGPDVTIEDVGGDGGTELVVLASDGVWKVMSNQEAVEGHGGRPEGAVAELVGEALDWGSEDDIACVVVRFH
ncbi:LOW QUALITY PROTEIN: probable protein phosphatase 2C 58 [Oryza glaberrima]|uniref:LOW QUALITY PROTEIN: probable protein phosphatase 2C 58 n=1 Tax=Oryza glaberrima TaxID=4538 RepID=UPI00224C09D4|nr:LOW QUALITY PROTEIN: probable protein phosphatase 2C 58 [Oryza glaberrima]